VDLGGKVLTEPGNATMIREGVNTRFGPPNHKRESAYPPDFVVIPNDPSNLPLASPDGTTVTHNGTPIAGIEDVAYSYVNYLADYAAKRFQFRYPQGRANRRIVTVPVLRAGQCGDTHGRKTVDVVGYASYLLLQPVCLPSHCAPGNDGWIFGQFLGEGEVSGNPGPVGGIGPYKIVLHNDPDSPDS
jgi:hypothetical protein